jgi:hypothetical protein
MQNGLPLKRMLRIISIQNAPSSPAFTGLLAQHSWLIQFGAYKQNYYQDGIQYGVHAHHSFE